jgi:hypothetical protein
MSRFSPSDAALEGFRLTRERPLTMLAWGLINFLGITVIGGLMLLMLGGPFVEFVQKGGLGAGGDPESLAAMLAKSWPAFLMLLAVVVLFMSVLTGGIYRLVLRPGERGFMHLRVGADELRLTAVNLLLFVIGLVCLIFVDLVGNLATTSGGVGAGLLAALVVAVPMIWIGVRLSLATPMTFAEHRIDLRAAWELTRGSFWPLFGMIILAAIFYVMVWALILIIYAAVVALSGGPESLKAIEAGVFTPQALVALLAVIVLQLILPVLQWVMLYSPLAVAYQHLRAPQPGG